MANNDNEFAMKCIDVLQKVSKYDPIAKQGQKKILEKYSWNSVIQEFEKKLVQISGK